MPHKPRKGVPFFDEEQEEEAYCAAPFNMNAPDVEAPLPTAFTQDGEEVTGLHLLLYFDNVKGPSGLCPSSQPVLLRSCICCVSLAQKSCMLMSHCAFTTVDAISLQRALLQDQALLPSSDEAGSGVCMGA